MNQGNHQPHHSPWAQSLADAIGILRNQPDLLEIWPVPLQRYDSLHPQAVRKLVFDSLEHGSCISKNSLVLADEILGTVMGSSIVRYPSRKQFISRVYQGDTGSEHEPEFHMLTGPAGVGKSVLIDLLVRMNQLLQPIQIDQNHGLFSHQSIWSTKVGTGPSAMEPLKELAVRSGHDLKSTRVSEATAELRNVAYRNGVALLVSDESQFGSSGDTTKRITNGLLNLSRLNVQGLVVCNLSLVARLFKSTDEVKQRYLNEIKVMTTNDPENSGWSGLIFMYWHTTKEYVDIDPLREDVIEQLWLFTFGLPRLLKQLWATAVAAALSAGDQRANFDHFVAVRNSPNWTMSRKYVEAFRLFLNTGEHGKSSSSDIKALAELKLVADDRAKDLYGVLSEEFAVKARLFDALSRKERKAHSSLSKATNSSPSKPNNMASTTLAEQLLQSDQMSGRAG